MESNNEENNKHQKISTIEKEENISSKENKEEFKKAIKIFCGINLIVFLLFIIFSIKRDLWSSLSSVQLGEAVMWAFFCLPFIQFIHIIPTIIFCAITKKYQILKVSLIVCGLTLLICPITCFGGIAFLTQINK